VSVLAGTWELVRLALRRDRILLPVCIAAFVLVVASSTKATVALYPSPQSRLVAAASVNKSPALVALYGRIYDERSLGAIAMMKMGGTGTALVAVLALLTVVRHTRSEEESGRLELLGATVVGRYAPLTAALLVSAGASLALGIFTALGLIAAGLPPGGSIAFGAAWAGVGIAFSAIAGFAAQLSRSARTAGGFAAAALGLAYLVRAFGDTRPQDGARWVSWLSPLGWGQQVRAFAGDRWWVLVLLLVFAVLATVAAYAVASYRDLGDGLLPDRPGSARASGMLAGSLGLAWRLQRGGVVAWCVAFFIVGAVLGSAVTSIGDLLDSYQAREFIQQLGGESVITDAFLAAEMGMLGVIAAVFGVLAANRLRSEEVAVRAEPLLATATSRVRWATSHIAVALGGTALLLVSAGLGAGIAYAVQSSDASQVGRVLLAALVQLPAVWVLVGIAAAGFGLAPRWTAVAWGALAVFFVLGEFGPVFKLDQWVIDLSPFAHIPKLPGGEVTMAPLLWLTAIAAAFIAAGLAGFRRRDVG
jgi:ABC-2 type transport system permease protein